MLKSFIFIFMSILVLSCSKQKNQIFYADGKPIVDSVEIGLVNSELKAVLKKKEFEVSGLRIYTSLESGMTGKLDELVNNLSDSIFANLKWQTTEDEKFTDSLKKAGKFLSAGALVMDNKTGQVVFGYSNWNRNDTNALTIKHQIGTLGRPLLFALAMKKEFNPNSRYPQISIRNNSEDCSVNRSFRSVISTKYGGTFSQGLGWRYSTKEQQTFLKSLEMNPENLERHPLFTSCELSLSDIAYFFQGICANGNFQKPHVIDSIADSEGKIIYRNKSVSKRLLDAETASEMQDLLGAYKNRLLRTLPDKFPGIRDFSGYFGVDATDRESFLVAVQQDYTTVLRIRNGGKFRKQGSNRKWNNPKDRTIAVFMKINELVISKYGQQPDYKLDEPEERKEILEIPDI